MLVISHIVSSAKYLFIFLLSILYSEFFPKGDNSTQNLPQYENLLGLGRRLENPYSVENMRRAYNALSVSVKAAVGYQSADDVIYTTHHYIKFTLKSEEELGKLKMDSTIILFPYPLDYEIISPANFSYREIHEDQPAYYYASVETDKKLPDGIEWEILEYLFIPDDYSDGKPMITTSTGLIMSEIFVESLVNKAFEITGNHESEEVTPASWRPAGRILYEDDKLGGTIGFDGIKVRANRWFTTHTGFTDISGAYRCDGIFKKPANYSFDFERYEFCVIGDGLYTDFKALNRMGDFDYSFSRLADQAEFFAATIFRAACHYYYKDIKNLHRPSINGLMGIQLKLLATNEVNDDGGYFTPAIRFWGLGTNILIFNPQNTTDDIYATAIHELSHAAHYGLIVERSGINNVNRDFQYAENKMVESWARGVQYFLTRMVYPDYRGGAKTIGEDYTNVVIDMIDTEEDAMSNNGLSSAEGDDVSGYRMDQIETALIGNSTWDGWKETIKNRYSNATKNDIDRLFASW